jgi:hypothetical protein
MARAHRRGPRSRALACEPSCPVKISLSCSITPVDPGRLRVQGREGRVRSCLPGRLNSGLLARGRCHASHSQTAQRWSTVLIVASISSPKRIIPRWAWWLSIPAAAAAIYLLLWFGPDVIARHDIGNVTGTLRTFRMQQARDAARGRLLTLGAGLFAAGALLFTGVNYGLARRTYELTEQGQVTDRYTKAIEQLGSKELDIRIGGIYALERVARDSATDHPTVIEVLAAFIREHSREQWPLPATGAPETGPPDRATRPDVQAALTVIGRRDNQRDKQPIDLTGADLTGADLSGADLSGAILRGARLRGARLSVGRDFAGGILAVRLLSKDLPGANLSGADLSDADLSGADAADADAVRFYGADLSGANLSRANLSFIGLAGARLSNAYVADANLRGANLFFADLPGASFDGTDLTGARWDPGTPVPMGWVLDDSALLSRGGADSHDIDGKPPPGQPL